MDRHELAWAAGFFDGEGSAWAQAREGRRTSQPMAQINQAGANGVPEVLERFRCAVGCGQIYGPKRMAGRIDLYSWVASSRSNVAQAFDAIAPWLGPVKAAQFSDALAFPLSADTWHEGTELERRSWAGGLFDGEGSTCLLRHQSRPELKVGEMSITQASPLTVPKVLERFAAVAGRGRIYGPLRDGKNIGLPAYRWKTFALDDILAVVHLIGPFIGRVKLRQAHDVIRVLAEQPVVLRGNPAWGNRKTHCVHGHEYAAARMRPFISRGKNVSRRDSKQCLACLREYARRTRDQRRK